MSMDPDEQRRMEIALEARRHPERVIAAVAPASFEKSEWLIHTEPAEIAARHIDALGRP